MSVKIFDTMTTATPNFPLAYAEKINVKLQDGTEDNLQNLFDNGELSGGDTSLTVTEAEYLALPEEQKLNNSYYLYDIGVHYKNGVAYSRKKPIQLTMEEYKALGGVDPDQEYIVSADEQGILLSAEDIGYNNAESGIQATTVQGAIDKIAETSGNVYSTEEKVIGTWIDGKPIYRKIFTFTDVSTDLDLSELNIETPIFVNYIANDKNRNWSIGTYPAQSTIQYDEYVKTGYYDSTQKKWIWQFGSVVRQNLVDGYFIIEYTKA